MKREIITITDEGAIVAPKDLGAVRMSVGEIAALLGVFYPTAKRHIRAIEQSGIADGDHSMCCVADRYGVHPEFYGIEMLAAVAFRVHSWQADTFRRWLMERATQPQQPVSVLLPWNVTDIYSRKICGNETN